MKRPSTSDRRSPGRIAVLRFGAVGDVVLTSTATSAIKRAWPAAEIVFCTKRAMTELVAHDPHVDTVLTLAPGESVRHFARRLAALGVDAVLDLHGKLRSRAVALLLPGRRHVRWHKRPWRDNLPVRLGLRPYHARMPIAARYHAAVEELIGEAVPAGALRCWVGPEDRQKAAVSLQAAHVDPARPLVGMAPGAKWATKRWPVQRFAVLARRAVDAGVQVVLTGSASETELLAAIRTQVPEAVDVGGPSGLGALMGVIERCDAFVAGDTGPMHIARALGVATLAIFGSTDPGQFDFAGHALLYADVPCSPCHFYGRPRCPKGHFRCMLDVDVETAWRRLAQLLAAPARRALVSG